MQNKIIFTVGKLFGYRGINRELTELKRMEKEIKTLRGLIPICSFCKKTRDEKGYWEDIELYISKCTDAEFTHGVCPKCVSKHYPEIGCNSCA